MEQPCVQSRPQARARAFATATQHSLIVHEVQLASISCELAACCLQAVELRAACQVQTWGHSCHAIRSCDRRPARAIRPHLVRVTLIAYQLLVDGTCRLSPKVLGVAEAADVGHVDIMTAFGHTLCKMYSSRGTKICHSPQLPSRWIHSSTRVLRRLRCTPSMLAMKVREKRLLRGETQRG